MLRGAGPLYFIAALLAIVTEAFWSAAYLTPSRLYGALVVYLVFALLFFAVPTIARRTGRPLTPPSASPVLLLASLALTAFLASHGIAVAALWGFAGLVGLIVTAIAIEASGSERPWFATLGMVGGWILLALWWLAIPTDALPLLPLLAVVAGLGLLMMGLSTWLGSSNRGPGCVDDDRPRSRVGARRTSLPGGGGPATNAGAPAVADLRGVVRARSGADAGRAPSTSRRAANRGHRRQRGGARYLDDQRPRAVVGARVGAERPHARGVRTALDAARRASARRGPGVCDWCRDRRGTR